MDTSTALGADTKSLETITFVVGVVTSITLGAKTKSMGTHTFAFGLNACNAFGARIMSIGTGTFSLGLSIPLITGVCGNVKFGLMTESARSGENSSFSIKMTCVIS